MLRDRELMKERERVEMIEREQERERERLREVEERRSKFAGFFVCTGVSYSSCLDPS